MCSPHAPQGTSPSVRTASRAKRTSRSRKEHIVQPKKKAVLRLLFSLVAEVGFEPHDLRVMSPTSYQAALLRDIWCRKPGSNRYEVLPSRDFKSRASASFAIPAFGTINPVFVILSQKALFVNTFSEKCLLFSEYKCLCKLPK